MNLSAVVNTKNCADSLERCLQSLSFADEIVIVDMHSDDDTVKIARQFTDKIFYHKDVGYVEPARNFAIDQAQGEWILVVDADEAIAPSLAAKIEELMADDDYESYFIPRKNIIFKRWIKGAGWWPDYQMRLFKKGKVVWQDKIHSIPKIKGSSHRLPARDDYAIIHYHYQTIQQFIERMNRYTDVEADGIKLKFEQMMKPLLLSFHQEFLNRFFSKKAIELENHGIVLSYLQSFYQLVTQLKLWEKQGFAEGSDNTSQVQVIQYLESVLSEYRFWIADWHINHTSGVRRMYWRIRKKLKV